MVKRIVRHVAFSTLLSAIGFFYTFSNSASFEAHALVNARGFEEQLSILRGDQIYLDVAENFRSEFGRELAFEPKNRLQISMKGERGVVSFRIAGDSAEVTRFVLESVVLKFLKLAALDSSMLLRRSLERQTSNACGSVVRNEGDGTEPAFSNGEYEAKVIQAEMLLDKVFLYDLALEGKVGEFPGDDRKSRTVFSVDRPSQRDSSLESICVAIGEQRDLLEEKVGFIDGRMKFLNVNKGHRFLRGLESGFAVLFVYWVGLAIYFGVRSAISTKTERSL